jgi:hypothetical protein
MRLECGLQFDELLNLLGCITVPEEPSADKILLLENLAIQIETYLTNTNLLISCRLVV